MACQARSRTAGGPPVSGELPARAGCGGIKFKPDIKALGGVFVRFDVNSREAVDVIVYATGYEISFPFFSDPALLPDAKNCLSLFKRMIKPGIDNLFFTGLAQPLPTLVKVAEQQADLVANRLMGRYRPPPEAETMATIAKDEALHRGRYYHAPRHRIQDDFGLLVHDLTKEIERGARRARAPAAAALVSPRAA